MVSATTENNRAFNIRNAVAFSDFAFCCKHSAISCTILIYKDTKYPEGVLRIRVTKLFPAQQSVLNDAQYFLCSTYLPISWVVTNLTAGCEANPSATAVTAQLYAAPSSRPVTSAVATPNSVTTSSGTSRPASRGEQVRWYEKKVSTAPVGSSQDKVRLVVRVESRSI